MAADGGGWRQMVADGGGWWWMVADGGGWPWMVADGGGWWWMAADGGGWRYSLLSGPQQGSPRAVPVHLLFFLSRNLLTFTNTISHNHSLKKFYN